MNFWCCAVLAGYDIRSCAQHIAPTREGGGGAWMIELRRTNNENMVTLLVSAMHAPTTGTSAEMTVGFAEKAKGYLALTKPRVVELLPAYPWA